jgi:hypothetical protein
MIILATAALTVFHPGYCFGQAWDALDWSFRQEKQASNDTQSA